MEITRKNISDIKKICIHDSKINDVVYHNDRKELIMKFESTWEDKSDVEIIFSNVIYYVYQNANYWSSGNTAYVYGISYDKENSMYKEMYNDYKKIYRKMNQNTVQYDENVIELFIDTSTGGKLTIVCEKIIVSEMKEYTI